MFAIGLILAVITWATIYLWIEIDITSWKRSSYIAGLTVLTFIIGVSMCVASIAQLAWEYLP